jgi:hypothetical protein
MCFHENVGLIRLHQDALVSNIVSSSGFAVFYNIRRFVFLNGLILIKYIQQPSPTVFPH